MKHLFCITREERTNLAGEVKSQKIQRGCIYNPTKGSSVQDVQIKNFDFKGNDWIDNLLGIIGYLKPADEPVKVICNKRVSNVGRMMEKAIEVIVLGKIEEDDELAVEIIQNAVNNGFTKDMLTKANESENKLEDFVAILIISVHGLKCAEDFSILQLKEIAHYILSGCRFDNIYYISDDSDGLQELKKPEFRQYWLNINAIKRAMTNGIELNSKDMYADVAPINIIIEEE